jgi:predicted transcriptional regulator
MNNDVKEFLELFSRFESFKSTFDSSNDTVADFVYFSKHAVIVKNRHFLKNINSLRNLLIHGHTRDVPMAFPNPSALDEFRRIVGQLEVFNSTVFEKFKCPVQFVRIDDGLDECLKIIKMYSISQIPIVNQSNDILEMLSTNTISRWLSDNFQIQGGVLAESTTISNLLPFIEYKQNYKVISRDTKLHSVYDAFYEHSINKDYKLDGMIITQNGRSNESMLGIVCLEDIIRFKP